MKKQLTFKEYWESKKRLREACESVPRVRNEYRLTKYCKFPVFESLDSDDKIYVSFKPKDKIEILWEKVNDFDDYPTAKCMILISEDEENKEVFPCWNNKKIHKWIENTTIET